MDLNINCSKDIFFLMHKNARSINKNIETICEMLRAGPCKNRQLTFGWKMDCLHFFYTSQATYPVDENALYFARFAFSIFERIFFFFIDKSKTTQNRKMNPQILVVTRCVLKSRTFNKTTCFFFFFFRITI